MPGILLYTCNNPNWTQIPTNIFAAPLLQSIELTAKLADLAGYFVYLAITKHADHTQNTYWYLSTSLTLYMLFNKQIYLTGKLPY